MGMVPFRSGEQARRDSDEKTWVCLPSFTKNQGYVPGSVPRLEILNFKIIFEELAEVQNCREGYHSAQGSEHYVILMKKPGYVHGTYWYVPNLTYTRVT